MTPARRTTKRASKQSVAKKKSAATKTVAKKSAAKKSTPGAAPARGLERARAFVATAAIPAPRAPRRARDGGAPAPARAVDVALEVTRSDAAVVGSDVVAFVGGVTPERREAIVNSSMLAQLVARQKVGDAAKIYEWYDAYFDVLTNIGWVIQDRGFAEYHERSDNFAAHEAILAVAATLLGAAPTALAIVTSAITALKKVDESTPWITIFSRESQHAKAARFQISLAEQQPDGQFLVTLMAFGLEATTSITQVLLFRVRHNEALLRHYSGKVTINTTVLDGVRDALRQKLTAHAADFVAALPALG